MRRIKFDSETIEKIRGLAQTNISLKELSNRIGIKVDTLRRVLWENKITLSYNPDMIKFEYDDETIETVRNLFENTKTPLKDIRDAVKLEQYEVQGILDKYYTKEEQAKRKSSLYRDSKLGEKNPMTGKFRSEHPNYKGEVSDGKGYLMCLKPDWYTGRKGSKHVFVHTIVMCEALGITELPAGFTVHHVDGNKHNNSIDNLALLTNSAHGKLHGILGKSHKR